MEQATNRFDALRARLEQLAANAKADDAESEKPQDSIRHTARRRLGIPQLFWESRLADFEPSDFKNPESFKRLVGLQAPPDSILIVGDNGAGKSHLAAAIAGRWGFRWRSVTLLLTEIRSTFNHYSGTSEFSIVKDLIQCERLVLDDISACALNTFAIVTLVAVLNGRIESMRPTIVTSAVGYAKLNKVDTNLSSRLAGFARLILAANDRRVDKEGIVRPCTSSRE